jgi:hypothetical protein
VLFTIIAHLPTPYAQPSTGKGGFIHPFMHTFSTPPPLFFRARPPATPKFRTWPYSYRCQLG